MTERRRSTPARRDSRRPAGRGGPPDGSATGRPPEPPGTAARRLAADALVRVDTEGAYANLVLPGILRGCQLDERDRSFVTELVYGATRMRRSCDWLVDRFLSHPPDARTRAVLRLGAYQLVFLQTPAYAAVNATVAAAPPRTRGLVNAVLRRVVNAGVPAEDGWPDEPTRLSYPDWIVDRLSADLGVPAAVAALEAMDEPAVRTRRADGYTQDLASQWVADLVGVSAGDRVLDVCAAPGGKTTAMATAGALVVAADRSPGRLGLVTENAAGLGLSEQVVALAADGTRPSVRPGAFDAVLLDAPCSGLGALRRRPDARWRIEPDDVERLAELQRGLLTASIPLVAPGGALVYSACTLTVAETVEIDRWLAARHPELIPIDPPGTPWEPCGRGARLLPQAAGTDGMFVLPLVSRRGRDTATRPERSRGDGLQL